MPFRDAVIFVAGPGAMPIARPVPDPMVATDLFDEFHITCVVIFVIELSLYVPVAMNCAVFPCTTELGPVIEMDCSVAGLTVSVKVFDVIPFSDTVMSEEPVPTALARPVFVPMVAAEVFAEFHVT
jgi:hypothetical protein